MKLSKKKQALIVSVSLVALLVTGIVAVQNLDNFNLNSKAESVDLDKQEYKDFINYYRKSDVSISIYSLNNLYASLSNETYVDRNTIEKYLCMSSDDVIFDFYKEEIRNYNKISKVLSNYNVSQTIDTDLLNNNDYIKNVDVSYLKKGSNSFKEVVTITNKYGFKITSEFSDELEEDINNPTRLGWIKYDPVKKNHTKAYGDRLFKGSTTSIICTITSKFGYKINDKGLTSRYIEGETTNIISPFTKAVVDSEVVTDNEAKKINENIDGHVRYKYTYASFFFGGAELCQSQHNMVITIKKWDKKKKNMVVEEKFQNLEKLGG